VVARVPPTNPVTTPPVAGPHLQFGADASLEMVVSWHTLQCVCKPRVMLRTFEGKLERIGQAKETSYTDAKAGPVVYLLSCENRPSADRLRLSIRGIPSHYLFGASHDSAAPEFSRFRTSPRGRTRFTFTSFGDRATPTLGKRYKASEGVTIANPYVNDNLGSPAAADTVLGVERLQPLFHLLNGDLCYANIAEDRVRTWWDFWKNHSRSARKRPWMPAAGDHENELGNGAIGYQTYFSLPEAPATQM
jgi:hypothetical protein